MQRSPPFLVATVIVTLLYGCSRSPTSPAATPSAPTTRQESIEIAGATAPAGPTLRLLHCFDEWGDVYACFKDLQLTLSVRSSQWIELAGLDVEFLTAGEKVCGTSASVTGVNLVPGVVATFRTSVVVLNPDCGDLLPLKMTRALIRVRYSPILE